ncbi:MAG: bifunctional 3,4-dihydroxy-2-butanone-4-phosphate synthase/GTP cyclohydrolase II [Firmicutes bacterium]|nr:bifunctional 3,4-dihydroxy-2-butanone-4-phosphate synthase/GTP cyclohydrolase II [Bacillota bacterium]
MTDRVAEALQQLREGRPILVRDDANRENETDLVALAQQIAPETVDFMLRYGRGLLCAPMSAQRARALRLDPMATRNEDRHQTAFTISVDAAEGTTTGISAQDRAMTLRRLADPQAKPEDFLRPGHLFPLVARPRGLLERRGHTEAAVDLARLAGAAPVAAICEVLGEKGNAATQEEADALAFRFGLVSVSVAEIVAYRIRHERLVDRSAEAALPTLYGDFRVIAYTSQIDAKEHVALVCGDLSGEAPVLCRIHSQCLTGDLFGSLRCDCGPQLHAALQRIAEEGRGVLLYLQQEGRGIGLVNKLRAYALQDEGMDTVEANEALGFAADQRDYGTAAQMLTDLGVRAVRLLTNNPQKVDELQACGITVAERLPLWVGQGAQNASYLAVKRSKLGHLA